MPQALPSPDPQTHAAYLSWEEFPSLRGPRCSGGEGYQPGDRFARVSDEDLLAIRDLLDVAQ